MKTRFFLGLAIVLISAFLVRTIGINQLPLYWEEAALGYDAYSVLRTGRDHHGNLLPFPSLPSFGDYKPAIYAYTIVPFLTVLDLSELAVRLPSAIAGSIVVGLVYLLAFRYFGFWPAIIGAGLAVFQPWGVHLSRVGFEVNLATAMIFLAVYLTIKRKQRLVYQAGAVVLLFLSMATYHSAKIVVPVLLVAFFVIMNKVHKIKLFSITMGVLVVLSILLSIPFARSLLSSDSQIRASQTLWIHEGEEVLQSNLLREQDSSELGWVLSHRYFLFGKRFLHEYIQGFSPSFFFLSGDGNARHQYDAFGVLQYWDLGLLLFGLLLLWKTQKGLAFLSLGMILVSAVPQAITTISPHTLRFATAYPYFMLITAAGVSAMLHYGKRSRKKSGVWVVLFGVGLTVFATWQIGSYLFGYSTVYPRVSAQEWQSGYAEMYRELANFSQEGDELIYITREQGRPAMYLWFHTKADPRVVQSEIVEAERDQLEYLSFDRYRFVNALPTNGPGILVSSPERMEEHREAHDAEIEQLSSVQDRYGNLVWVIWRYL